jgi:hypothetical protein
MGAGQISSKPKNVSHPLRSSREDRKEYRECGKIRIPEYRTANLATVS